MALEEFVRKFSLNKRVAEQLSSNPGDQIEEVRLVQESKARTLIPANGSASDIHWVEWPSLLSSWYWRVDLVSRETAQVPRLALVV